MPEDNWGPVCHQGRPRTPAPPHPARPAKSPRRHRGLSLGSLSLAGHHREQVPSTAPAGQALNPSGTQAGRVGTAEDPPPGLVTARKSPHSQAPAQGPRLILVDGDKAQHGGFARLQDNPARAPQGTSHFTPGPEEGALPLRFGAGPRATAPNGTCAIDKNGPRARGSQGCALRRKAPGQKLSAWHRLAQKGGAWVCEKSV